MSKHQRIFLWVARLNIIDAQIKKLRAEIAWARGLDWKMPEPPEAPLPPGSMRLRPLARSAFAAFPPARDLDAVRWELASKVHVYASNAARGLFLVKVPAGVGKTHALVGAAQAVTRAGGRVLWAAQDHAAWEDFGAFPDFNSDAWLHWQGITRVNNAGVPLCRYNYAMQQWLARGYPARELCTRLCLPDGWMENDCLYCEQSRSKRPGVFGQHAHLVYGLPGRSFELAVVDELPLKAFTRERLIPWRAGVYPIHSRLRGGGLTGRLFQALVEASYRVQGRLAGRALLDVLGPALNDVYAAVETGFWQAPQIPVIFTPEDVKNAEYFFLHDLLAALTIEHTAWLAGWEGWATRAWVSERGVHILGRHGLWDELPRKVIILDATAQPALYRLMFREKIISGDNITWRRRKIREVYAPRVKRVGRLYQVTGRLNSKKQLYAVGKEVLIRHENGREEHSREINPLPALKQVARAIVALAQQHRVARVGLVTYKAIEGALCVLLVAAGLVVTSRHFYNIRGTNALQGVELLAVVGSPTPAQADIIKLATALDASRQTPFIEYDDAGRPRPVYVAKLEELRLTPDALQGAVKRQGWAADTAGVARVVSGYRDAALRAIHDQTRAAEILQAGHRGRVNIQNIPVYVFTSTPMLDEPLDGVFDDPPIGPAGIPWRTWLRLQAWLDTLEEGVLVGAEELAAAVRVSARHVVNEKWVAAIVAYYADLAIPEAEKWYIPELMQKGRGRPKVQMTRREAD